jgi:hypothetical protein
MLMERLLLALLATEIILAARFAAARLELKQLPPQQHAVVVNPSSRALPRAL